MFVAAEPLTDLSRWARSSGLEIVLLVTGAILLTRFSNWLGGRIIQRIDAKARETDAWSARRRPSTAMRWPRW